MEPLILSIHTINEDIRDYQYLFQLWETLNRDSLEVIFDFSRCGFLRQNAIAFLGGLIRLVDHRGGTAHINRDSLRDDVRRNLTRQGFLSVFGDSVSSWDGNSIPYREDRDRNKTRLMQYLKNMWLGRGWIDVSKRAQDAIVGNVSEIYDNAFEHGQSPIGLFSCGQYDPRLQRL